MHVQQSQCCITRPAGIVYQHCRIVSLPNATSRNRPHLTSVCRVPPFPLPRLFVYGRNNEPDMSFRHFRIPCSQVFRNAVSDVIRRLAA
jgi:hypothetical protein